VKREGETMEYVIFLGGIVVGAFLGLFLAGLCIMAREGETEQERWERLCRELKEGEHE